MAYDIRFIMERLNHAFPDHYLTDALERTTQQEMEAFRPKKTMAECILKIVMDLHDDASTPTENLRRIEGGLDLAQQHLEEVRAEVVRLRREAGGRGLA